MKRRTSVDVEALYDLIEAARSALISLQSAVWEGKGASTRLDKIALPLVDDLGAALKPFRNRRRAK